MYNIFRNINIIFRKEVNVMANKAYKLLVKYSKGVGKDKVVKFQYLKINLFLKKKPSRENEGESLCKM